MTFRQFLASLAVVSCVLPAAADAEPVSVKTLPNGLKVIVKEDHRSPLAVHMLWYKTGAVDEKGFSTGVAHVYEHMMFKGTKNIPAGRFEEAVTKAGGVLNAFTGSDYTAYYEKVPKDALPLMMRLEADRMVNFKAKKDDFDKEIRVIREERRLRTEDDPESKLQEALEATAYIAHEYRNPVIGWMGDLYAMKVTDVNGWHEKRMTPSNAVLVVVGDVKPAEVFSLAAKTYGKAKKRKLEMPVHTAEPQQKGMRRVEVKARAENELVTLAWKTPRLKDVMKDRDVYALDVLSAVLDGYDNARLPAKFVRENKTAIQVDADYEAIGRGPGLFVISGVPAKGISCEELEKSFKESVRDIAENGVTEKELNRVKRQLIASRTFKRDSIFSQAYEIGAFETAGPGYEQIETVIGQLKSVTPDEVKSVAKRYFTDDTLTVAKLIPLAASVPAEQNTATAREGGAK